MNPSKPIEQQAVWTNQPETVSKPDKKPSMINTWSNHKSESVSKVEERSNSWFNH